MVFIRSGFFTAATVSPSPYVASPRYAVEAALIAALESSSGLLHLKQTHGRLLRVGLSQSSFLVSKLLRRLTDHGVPMDPYPRLIFSQVLHPNSFLWTALIRGYALLGPFHRSIINYSLMRRRRDCPPPLSFTFSALFKSCGSAQSLHSGAQLHAHTILMGGFHSDLFVQNTMMDMYVRCGRVDLARRVFDEMPFRDVISWTCLIVAYSRIGDMPSAEDFFGKSPAKDTVAWTAMVTGYAQNARPRDSLRMFERMREEGVEFDGVTLACAMSACAQLGAVAQAARLRDLVLVKDNKSNNNNNNNNNVMVGSAMVDMLAKCGLVDEAVQVFGRLEERNVYTYSAMISGLAAHGRSKKAIELFEEMAVVGTDHHHHVVKPNEVTFIGVLTACSHGGMVDEGRHYFKAMESEFGITPSADHYTCMVDMLGRAGLVEEAYELAKSMPTGPGPAPGVWGALLGACRIHGKFTHIAETAANALFELEPDSIGNYVLLSNFYASLGMWESVSKVRKLMRKRGLRKNPACSWFETEDGSVHEFFAGGDHMIRSREIKEALEELVEKCKLAGYVPNLRACVAYDDLSDEEKERLLKGHSEKLALAFGLLTIAVGGTIRIVKNLRVCEDCHSLMCFASSFIGRVVVLRDNMRFHHFQDGACSCRSFW